MKKFKGFTVLVLAALLLVFAGCTVAEPKVEAQACGRSITLMTWNVHNLFDGVDDGYEYTEFLVSSGWSTEKYKGRLNSISAAIDTMETKPDIIILQEIESHKVLEELACVMSRDYSWNHFANNHGSAIGLGVLSRFPLADSRVHSITINGETTPRPVLETRVQTGEEDFVIFACHWKSKIGGDEATENVRRSSAKVIVRRIRELWENEPLLGIILAGDLNENHDEFYRQASKLVCALMPDDPYCAQLTGCLGADSDEIAGLQKDFIVLSKNMPPVPINFPLGAVTLFSPWMNDLENGTYFYKYNWETIDHFLLSAQFFDNTGWEYEKAMIADFAPFTNSGGLPASYNSRTGSGLSDHLPLLLILKRESGEQASAF